MKINYDNFGRISEIKFDEGEDQAAFWDAYKHEISEKKEVMIAKEKEVSIRNKDYIDETVKMYQQNCFNFGLGGCYTDKSSDNHPIDMWTKISE